MAPYGPLEGNFPRPLSDDPARSWTLPAYFYFDPAIYAAEKEKIFFRSWQYLGPATAVAKPGGYIAGNVVDQPVFVLRDRQGQLRGYYNVCLHRAHELLKGSGQLGAAAITCPYHAWTYDEMGRLKAAPNSATVADFNLDDFALTPIAVEIFAGLVFVNLDRQAKPLAEQAPRLAADLARYVPNLDKLDLKERQLYGGTSTRANWKVVVDNYVECYHCGPAHPAFADIIDMSAYRQEVDGLVSRQLGLKTRPKNTAYDFAPDAAVTHAAFWFLWPNITFNVMPGNLSFSVAVIEPKGVEETVFWADRYADSDERDLGRMAYGRDVLGPEDTALCESVQRGLKARVYRQGRIMTDAARSGVSEHGIHHFHRLVRQALEG